MRVAIDAMGGDFAPREIVLGAVKSLNAIPELEKLILVGAEDQIRKELSPLSYPAEKLEIFNTTEVVGMDEAPAVAVRRKKDSSINRAVDMVKLGKADAVFSAGNTGAAVASTTLKLRTLPGVNRPAIATVIPTPVKPFILIDAGANTDCSAEMLYQFALMGSVYSRIIFGVQNPRIGLMSIGGEDAKGNEVTKLAFKLIEASKLNFSGNVEGHDLFKGEIDVVVCDGFVGNIVLKTSESVAHAIGHWMKDQLTMNLWRKIGALICSGAFKTMKELTDPAVYGGAPLLGINGICIIGHGASSAKAVANAIQVACRWIKHDLNDLIVKELELTVKDLV